MKAKVKRGARGVNKRRARELSRALPGIAAKAQKAAYLQAALALNAGVYGTAPGRYRRTGNLRQSLSASAQANGTSIGLQVIDTAEYASAIEFGTGPHELSAGQLAAYLEAMPEGGLLNFGRSGKAYMLPHPYIGVGLYKGRSVTLQELRALLQRLWA